MRFSGKRALVTGAASGIGHAVRAALTREGAEVLAADISFPSTDAASNTFHLDVSNEDDWEQLAAKMASLDVMVASAGISDAKPIADTSLADWRRVLAVNLDGAFLSIKYGSTAMQQRSGGVIVLVSSASGIKTCPGASAYCAGKAGVRMLVKAAALELKPEGIRVNCVSPGGVVTPMWKNMPFWRDLLEKHGGEEGAWKALGGAERDTPSIQRMAFPEEVASAILFLCSDEAAHITGADLVIDAGYSI